MQKMRSTVAEALRGVAGIFERDTLIAALNVAREMLTRGKHIMIAFGHSSGHQEKWDIASLMLSDKDGTAEGIRQEAEVLLRVLP